LVLTWWFVAAPIKVDDGDEIPQLGLQRGGGGGAGGVTARRNRVGVELGADRGCRRPLRLAERS
jgi:hypothetical protein